MHDVSDGAISSHMQMIQSSIRSECKAEMKLNKNIHKFRQGLS